MNISMGIIRRKKICKGRGKYLGRGCGTLQFIFSNGLCQFCVPKNAIKKVEEFKVRTVTGTEKQLQTICHKYIRLRDAKRNCISCGKKSVLQAGHFWAAGNYSALRYDEININGQCYVCNIPKSGNVKAYRVGMIAKYGQAQIDLLDARRHDKLDLTEDDMKELIIYYEDKIEKLKQVA